MWLVARTESRKERWAQENIANQGYEAYLPQYRERITSAGKVRVHAHPRLLFPGYIFCRTDGPFVFLTGTRGISQLLMSGSRPGIVPDDLIAALKLQEDEEGFISLPDGPDDVPRPRVGEAVRLRAGPFLSYIGIYDGRSSGDFERVLLECFGRRTVLKVRLEDIEKAGL